MKKILTLVAITIILASNFVSASTLITGMGGKSTISSLIKTAHSKKYTKISAKDFSVKNMQDTKDILMESETTVTLNGSTTSTLAAR